MASMIGNEILDIGSRKGRRQRGDPFAPPMVTMGAPGQFDLPNVPDVRSFTVMGVLTFLVFQLTLTFLLLL